MTDPFDNVETLPAEGYGPNDFHLVLNGVDEKGRPVHSVLPGLGPEVDAILAQRRPQSMDAERTRLTALAAKLALQAEELALERAELEREKKSLPAAHRK